MAGSITNAIFFHYSSSVKLFPISQEAKPHCGLKQRLSRLTYLDTECYKLFSPCKYKAYTTGEKSVEAIEELFSPCRYKAFTTQWQPEHEH